MWNVKAVCIAQVNRDRTFAVCWCCYLLPMRMATFWSNLCIVRCHCTFIRTEKLPQGIIYRNVLMKWKSSMQEESWRYSLYYEISGTSILMKDYITVLIRTKPEGAAYFMRSVVHSTYSVKRLLQIPKRWCK
jgi:hypothetical protein